jgi:cytochrome P450
VSPAPPFYFNSDLPTLRYIPAYLHELQEGHDEELALFTSQLNHVRQKIERGDEVIQSFGKYVIERQKELDLSDNEAAYLAGSVFGAGSDTTASGISISVLAAACYPTEQQRVWEELESVVGRERAPTLMDQDKLPLTMAWVLEILRWRPVTAGGFPHKATRDILWVRSRLFLFFFFFAC